MLSQAAFLGDLDLVQWRRLTGLAYARQGARRVILLHEGGKPVRLYDTLEGELPLPEGQVKDAKRKAEELFAAHAGVHAAWVVDPDSFRKAMAEVQKSATLEEDLDAYALREFEARMAAPGCAVFPERAFLWHGIPLKAVRNFCERMMPPSCAFVLAVFEGEEIWAGLLAEFQDKKLVSLRGFDSLDAADLKDVKGRDQHPFLLSLVANTLKRPSFGWFVERADFEAWMTAQDDESKQEAFQKALMENRATFDFNALLDRHITAFSPINPGEAAVAGQDREANPRTKTPDPDEPGPSAM